MKTIFRFLRYFANDENGPTAVEYAVMLGLIIAGVIFSINSVGQNVSAMFDNVSQVLNTGGGGGAPPPPPAGM